MHTLHCLAGLFTLFGVARAVPFYEPAPTNDVVQPIAARLPATTPAPDLRRLGRLGRHVSSTMNDAMRDCACQSMGSFSTCKSSCMAFGVRQIFTPQAQAQASAASATTTKAHSSW